MERLRAAGALLYGYYTCVGLTIVQVVQLRWFPLQAVQLSWFPVQYLLS